MFERVEFASVEAYESDSSNLSTMKRLATCPRHLHNRRFTADSSKLYTYTARTRFSVAPSSSGIRESTKFGSQRGFNKKRNSKLIGSLFCSLFGPLHKWRPHRPAVRHPPPKFRNSKIRTRFAQLTCRNLCILKTKNVAFRPSKTLTSSGH